MRLAMAFFRRDATMALSYRTAFAMQIVTSIVFVLVFCFLGRAMNGSSDPSLVGYGSMTAYILVGVSMADCVGLSLTTFANHIREGQLTGTLEVTLVSPTPLPMILIYSSLWPYFFCAMRFVIFLAMGIALFGVGVHVAGIPAAILIFILTVLSFMGVGILWASAVMLLKRGEAVQATFGFLIWMLSGVLYPASMLPLWLQPFSKLIPLTTANEGMRKALLQGQTLEALAPVIFQLLIFAVVLITAGIFAFNQSVRIARESGSLATY